MNAPHHTARQPAGTPGGGQFAPAAAPRPVVRLGDASVRAWMSMSSTQAATVGRTFDQLAESAERAHADGAAAFYREQHRTLGLAVPAAGLPTIGPRGSRGWREMTPTEIEHVRGELLRHAALSDETAPEAAAFYRASQTRLDEISPSTAPVTGSGAGEPAPRRRWPWSR